MMTGTYKRFCGLSPVSPLFFDNPPKKHPPKAWSNLPGGGVKGEPVTPFDTLRTAWRALGAPGRMPPYPQIWQHVPLDLGVLCAGFPQCPGPGQWRRTWRNTGECPEHRPAHGLHFENIPPKSKKLPPNVPPDFAETWQTTANAIERQKRGFIGEKEKSRTAVNHSGFEFGPADRNRTCI